MIRKIIEIDQEKCNGCKLCVNACHEGAIGMIDDKAILLRDDYCDGLGDCLPVCPTGAIKFTEREALEFDKEAVMENMKMKKESIHEEALPCGCPGTLAKELVRSEDKKNISRDAVESISTQLKQWPVQIQLVPTKAPYFDNTSLLVAADCTAYAYGNFHNDFMKGKVTLIGCPKLDSVVYSEKLTEIIKNNNIKNVTVVRMEVPCCAGIENAVKEALIASGKFIPWQIVTITTDGQILED